MSYSNGPRMITDGIKLYLDPANRKSYAGSGPTVRNIVDDSTTNRTDGYMYGPTHSGQNNGTFVFDGVDDFIIVQNSTSGFGVGGGFPNCTLSTWAKITRTNNNQFISGYIDDWGGITSNFFGFYFLLNDSGGSTCDLLARVQNTLGGYEDIVVDYIPYLNKWVNITFMAYWEVSGPKFSKLYFNGAYMGGADPLSNNAFGATSYHLQIGDHPQTTAFLPGMPTNGSIGPVLFYNRGLSPTEVLQNYNATKTRFGL